MPGNHPLQQNQYIGCFNRAVSMKNVALPRIVIDDAQNTQFAATLGVVRNEIPRPHVVLVFGLLRQTRGQTAAALSRFGRRYLQSLFAAYALHLFLVYPVAHFTQHLIDYFVAKSRVLPRQANDCSLQQLLLFRHRLGAVAQGRAVESQPSPYGPPGTRQSSLNFFGDATLSLRAQMFFSKASSRAFIFRSWSASFFLSSVFSLPSSFNLRASFTFVPPYLLLHR